MLLLVALTGALGACHAEPVIPFPDAGDPCATPSGSHAIDCARFPDTTCGADGTGCPRDIYGCADAAYYSTQDYSQCPPEAGGRDATLFGDVGLFADDAFTGPDASGDGGD